MSIDAPLLEIWTIIDMVQCNFNCPYCASTKPEHGQSRSKDRLWKNETSSERFQKLIKWVAQLPVPVGLRLQTVGEPFMCEEFLRGAAWLSNQPNIHYLELVTNGSLVQSRWDWLAREANLGKISLWMTYHHTQTSAEKIVQAARFAQEHGAHVVVNSLVFPENYAAVDQLRALATENHLKVSTDIGYDLHSPTSAQEFVPALHDDEARARNLYGHDLILKENVSNHWQQKCAAGYNYVYIAPEGDIYRCFEYFLKDRDATLGNIFEPDFKLSLRDSPYEPCLFSTTELCFNHEDFFHLETIDRKRTISRSMTYKNDVSR